MTRLSQDKHNYSQLSIDILHSCSSWGYLWKFMAQERSNVSLENIFEVRKYFLCKCLLCHTFVEFVFVVVLVCPRCGTIMALDLYD